MGKVVTDTNEPNYCGISATNKNTSLNCMLPFPLSFHILSWKSWLIKYRLSFWFLFSESNFVKFLFIVRFWNSSQFGAGFGIKDFVHPPAFFIDLIEFEHCGATVVRPSKMPIILGLHRRRWVYNKNLLKYNLYCLAEKRKKAPVLFKNASNI